jgi:hypothetical protein
MKRNSPLYFVSLALNCESRHDYFCAAKNYEFATLEATKLGSTLQAAYFYMIAASIFYKFANKTQGLYCSYVETAGYFSSAAKMYMKCYKHGKNDYWKEKAFDLYQAAIGVLKEYKGGNSQIVHKHLAKHYERVSKRIQARYHTSVEQSNNTSRFFVLSNENNNNNKSNADMNLTSVKIKR